MNIHVKLTELRIAHVTQKRQDFSAFMQNVFPVILFGGDTYVRADSCAES